MKKNNNADHKSNLNTSCASDLQSSMLSSLCDTDLNDSLLKIDELKQLYLQTCQQQTALLQQNAEYVALLDKLKRELELLVDLKFGIARIKKKPEEVPEKIDKPNGNPGKQYKAGSIAKIRRERQTNHHELNVNRPTARQPTFRKQDCPPQFKQGREEGVLEDSSVHPIHMGHRKTASSIIPSFDSFQNTFKRPHQNPRRSDNAGMENYDQIRKFVKSGMLTQRQDSENVGLAEMGSKKSYLNSPRASLLNSPRTTLIK